MPAQCELACKTDPYAVAIYCLGNQDNAGTTKAGVLLGTAAAPSASLSSADCSVNALLASIKLPYYVIEIDRTQLQLLSGLWAFHAALSYEVSTLRQLEPPGYIAASANVD